MNVYFLVEGKQCERKLYPIWLSYITPHLLQVDNLASVKQNNYVLISARGFPSIIGNHLANAIRDIEETQRFDLLVVVLDADEETVQDRMEEVRSAAKRTKLKSAHLEVVVQNRCIETWLLGNRRIFPRQPQEAELRRYIEHYDVHQHDPEQMPKHVDFTTHSQFHHAYLKSIFYERGISYSKIRPGHAGEKSYFDQLTQRVSESPDHIKTFSFFLRLCESF